MPNSAPLGKDILLADLLQLALRGGRRGGWVIHCARLEAQALSNTWNILEWPYDVVMCIYTLLYQTFVGVPLATNGLKQNLAGYLYKGKITNDSIAL